MHHVDPSTEAALEAMTPAALDEDLLIRLESCARGSWTTAEAGELEFERRLRQWNPAPLSGAFLERLESACFAASEPVTAAVVPFPARGRFWRSRTSLAAAAAIALLGAAAALLVPQPPGNAPVAAGNADVAPPLADVRSFVPAGYGRGLSEARHEGVIWRDDGPHRVVRVVYMDRVTLRNAKGEMVEVEQPRIDYILVPAKVD